MEVLQKMDLREEIKEFSNIVKSYISSQNEKTYVALDILKAIDSDEKTILELIKRFCNIELTKFPKINDYSFIKGYLDKAENLYTKLIGE